MRTLVLLLNAVVPLLAVILNHWLPAKTRPPETHYQPMPKDWQAPNTRASPGREQEQSEHTNTLPPSAAEVPQSVTGARVARPSHTQKRHTPRELADTDRDRGFDEAALADAAERALRTRDVTAACHALTDYRHIAGDERRLGRDARAQRHLAALQEPLAELCPWITRDTTAHESWPASARASVP